MSEALVPERALEHLAATLRSEGTLLSPLVVEPREKPDLGLLVASGPRAAADPGAYALFFETIREGSHAHYGTPRVLDLSSDPDLALLAGDYLYSRGLERLAALGDLEAVRVLAELIGFQASRPSAEALADAWHEAAVAVGFKAP